MVLGFLIARKRYNLKTVISVISIIVGVIIFNSHQKLDSKETVNDNLLWGNLLIAASLLFDGLLGATEDKMRENSIPSDLSYLYYFNLWGIGLRLLGVLVFNETPKLIDFTTRHPEIIKFFALAILIGDIGQFFANSIILRFGPLSLSVTTTVRKFFSVILSVIIYNNSLQWQQWAAAALILSVMIALSVDAFLNSKKTSTEQHNELEENIETVDNELEKLDKNKKKFSDKNEEFHTGKIWISEYI
jgi:solute carrier family 35 (UDP-galactose transporter), member B1